MNDETEKFDRQREAMRRVMEMDLEPQDSFVPEILWWAIMIVLCFICALGFAYLD